MVFSFHLHVHVTILLCNLQATMQSSNINWLRFQFSWNGKYFLILRYFWSCLLCHLLTTNIDKKAIHLLWIETTSIWLVGMNSILESCDCWWWHELQWICCNSFMCVNRVTAMCRTTCMNWTAVHELPDVSYELLQSSEFCLCDVKEMMWL